MLISYLSSYFCSSDLEHSLVRLVPVTTAEEITYRAGTYAVARRITFGLDVNPVKSQLILIDHTINAIVSAAPERTPSFSNRSRSEEHTSELQSLMRISYAVFCLKKKKKQTSNTQRLIVQIITNNFTTNRQL